MGLWTNAARRFDIVEPYAPLRETPSGPIIGVPELYRGVGGGGAVQLTQTKDSVWRTMLLSVRGLLLALTGFVVAADISIIRSKKREKEVTEQRAIEPRQLGRYWHKKPSGAIFRGNFTTK